MSACGIFAVDRGVFEHEFFAPEPYTEREAWLWMVASAVWKDRRVRAGRKMVDLVRGQLAFSERFLAERWKWPKSTVRRFIGRLKTEEMVTTLADHDMTIITICNYEKYAFDGSARGPQTGPLADHSRTKEEEGKKVRSKKEVRGGATRLPPDWHPSEADLIFAAKYGFAGEALDRQILIFRNYWKARAKDATRVCWSATWQNWILKEQRGFSNGQAQPKPKRSGSLLDAIDRELERLEGGGNLALPAPPLRRLSN